MKFMCPHCGAIAFRLLSGADGKPAAECLNCGRASTFDQSMLPERDAPAATPKPSGSTK
jgi:transcription elongation factor Elf1